MAVLDASGSRPLLGTFSPGRSVARCPAVLGRDAERDRDQRPRPNAPAPARPPRQAPSSRSRRSRPGKLQRGDGPHRAARRRRLEPGPLRGPPVPVREPARHARRLRRARARQAPPRSRSFRSLARKGFDFIIGTSFGYMDSHGDGRRGVPRSARILHLTGYKSNGKNFGNFFGAVEDMKYLAGMLAGSRAKKDGNPKIGYMATFPIPEEAAPRQRDHAAAPSRPAPSARTGRALDRHLA